MHTVDNINIEALAHVSRRVSIATVNIATDDYNGFTTRDRGHHKRLSCMLHTYTNRTISHAWYRNPPI